jgi:hypothetical protein
MDKTRSFVLVLALACTFGGDASCLDFDEGRPSPSRELDRACRNGGCVVSGAASLGSGPTSDTIGIHMGPGESSATIVLTDIFTPTDYTWHLELLVAGSGTFTGSEMGCTLLPDGSANRTILPSEGYAWVRASDCADRPLTVTATTVTVSGTAGSTMDIADVRSFAYPTITCSIPRSRSR